MSTNAFELSSQVISRAYEVWREDPKEDHVSFLCILNAYDAVLLRNGICPKDETAVYQLLLKLNLKSGHCWWDRFQTYKDSHTTNSLTPAAASLASSHGWPLPHSETVGATVTMQASSSTTSTALSISVGDIRSLKLVFCAWRKLARTNPPTPAFGAIAKAHWETAACHNTLCSWRATMHSVAAGRRVSQSRSAAILLRCLRCWQMASTAQRDLRSLHAHDAGVAESLHSMHVLRRCLQHWRDASHYWAMQQEAAGLQHHTSVQVEVWQIMSQQATASRHHRQRIQTHTFLAWRDLCWEMKKRHHAFLRRAAHRCMISVISADESCEESRQPAGFPASIVVAIFKWLSLSLSFDYPCIFNPPAPRKLPNIHGAFDDESVSPDTLEAADESAWLTTRRLCQDAGLTPISVRKFHQGLGASLPAWRLATVDRFFRAWQKQTAQDRNRRLQAWSAWRLVAEYQCRRRRAAGMHAKQKLASTALHHWLGACRQHGFHLLLTKD